MGASAVECDIHLTKDAQIVLIHDPNTLRTAGIDISVKDANYSELKQLDVGSFKDTKYAGEKIPLLADIIRTIPSDKKKKLFIEIKCGPEILPHLNQVIENSEKKEQIVFIGFNIDTVSQLKKVMPDIPAFWLVMTDKDKKTGKWIPHNSDLITKTKKCGIDGLGLHWAGLNKSFVQKAHKESLGVHVWTVDKIEIARKLKKIGVDGITSNKLNLLMQEINSN
jgi:glycerophosphoryl diester phosphodiesterase